MECMHMHMSECMRGGVVCTTCVAYMLQAKMSGGRVRKHISSMLVQVDKKNERIAYNIIVEQSLRNT